MLAENLPEVFTCCDACGEAILVGDHFKYITASEEIAVSTDEMVTHERLAMNIYCVACASGLDLSRLRLVSQEPA